MNRTLSIGLLFLLILLLQNCYGQTKSYLDSLPFELVPKNIETMRYNELDEWLDQKAQNNSSIYTLDHTNIGGETHLNSVRFFGNGLVEHLHVINLKGEDNIYLLSATVESTQTFFRFEEYFKSLKQVAKCKRIKRDEFWLKMYLSSFKNLTKSIGNLSQFSTGEYLGEFIIEFQTKNFRYSLGNMIHDPSTEKKRNHIQLYISSYE